jgi:RNA polymerase sigma-70 factor (ECF subfamily)
MDGDPDSELIEQVVTQGSEAAFRALYRRHSPRLYQLHLRFAGGVVADAEDLLQETWLRAARLLRTFRREGSLFSWLRGIAMNVVREWLRRTSREANREPDVDPDDVPAVAQDLPAHMDIGAAIAALPEGYRAVLILHDVEGLTHAEIAEALGIAVGTTKSQLFAARRAMRLRLGASRSTEDRASG